MNRLATPRDFDNPYGAAAYHRFLNALYQEDTPFLLEEDRYDWSEYGGSENWPTDEYASKMCRYGEHCVWARPMPHGEHCLTEFMDFWYNDGGHDRYHEVFRPHLARLYRKGAITSKMNRRETIDLFRIATGMYV